MSGNLTQRRSPFLESLLLQDISKIFKNVIICTCTLYIMWSQNKPFFKIMFLLMNGISIIYKWALLRIYELINFVNIVANTMKIIIVMIIHTIIVSIDVN